jgi:hypothetical protein
LTDVKKAPCEITRLEHWPLTSMTAAALTGGRGVNIVSVVAEAGFN